MRLLKPGTGNQKANRGKAVRFIVEHIIDAADFDLDSGVVTAKDGTPQGSPYKLPETDEC
jgi:hypothetical protein